MEKLTDFKPLDRVVLSGIGELNCSGLILVVGPNSSGKTQLLHDLQMRLSGEPRLLIVAERIDVRKPEYKSFMECLQREGYVMTFIDDTGNPQIRPKTSYLGTGQGAGQIQRVQADSWNNSYAALNVSEHKGRVEFLNYFGRFLLTALFLENRLTLVKQVGGFDYETQPPQNDLHALYINEEAKRELSDETSRVFARAVWLDASRGNILCLRVSDSPTMPSAEDRLSPQTMTRFRTMENEGDGLKSYIATCIALLLGRRPVCIIDEPEMCLHPPQAYNLGPFIGRFGTSTENATFVATHSSHILRGVIQTSQSLQIVTTYADCCRIPGALGAI